MTTNNVHCKLKLPDLSENDKLSNIITIDRVDYLLFRNRNGNKGGNSWIYQLYDIGQIEDDDPLPEMPDRILKINRFPIENYSSSAIKRNRRFDQEIEALYKCSKKPFVIDIYNNGNIIDITHKTRKFYCMEFAEYDLKSFMESKKDLSKSDKISICIKLTQALNDLFSAGYYHRDIKPDNFFLTPNKEWKIGDLGLVEERNKENEIDDPQEFIGPRGWTSPEAMNKVLTDKDCVTFDRAIDHKSDIFQLGLVFWYVMQGNAPIGCIMENDFIENDHALYSIIRQMISHPKSLRPPNFSFIITRLNEIANNELK